MLKVFRRVRFAAAGLVLVLGLTATALAAARLEVQTSQALTVQGTAPQGAWIGVSLYPAGARSAAQAKHMVRRVEAGDFSQSFAIPSQCRGGTFEVALWRQQVPLAACRVPRCQWCARNGFHMDGLILYRAGKIPPG